jgi:outer membrane protein TolC
VRGEEVRIELSEGIKAALTRRPEIVREAYQADSDRTRYEYWSGQTLPSLNLVGSYGAVGLAGEFFSTQLDPTDPTGQKVIRTLQDSRPFSDAYSDVLHNRNKNWSIGINLSYPIFNRAARGARGAARYTWESSKALLTTIEQNVIVEVRAAARAIDTARRSILAAQKGRELAEKNLDAEKKKFDNGMTTSFQVTQIQRDLSAARTNELQALAVYRKALASYHYAIADSLDWKGIRIEGIPETSPPPAEARAQAR